MYRRMRVIMMKIVMMSIAAKLFFKNSLKLVNKVRFHRWGSLVVQCVVRNALKKSAFVTALNELWNVKHVIYWVDNCTAQNKNWCLLTTLVSVVNDPTSPLEDITLMYFEPGHTFMSDSFHHGVEKEMRKRPRGAVLDFKNVIASSNSGKVKSR